MLNVDLFLLVISCNKQCPLNLNFQVLHFSLQEINERINSVNNIVYASKEQQQNKNSAFNFEKLQKRSVIDEKSSFNFVNPTKTSFECSDR